MEQAIGAQVQNCNNSSLHLVLCIDLFTVCKIKPKKFLKLEISGYFILQDLLIISLDFSYLELKSCSKQVT
jgi:hypothetical protein